MVERERSQFQSELAVQESYEQLLFLFRLLLRFQAGGPLFLHTSLGICQFLQAHQEV